MLERLAESIEAEEGGGQRRGHQANSGCEAAQVELEEARQKKLEWWLNLRIRQLLVLALLFGHLLAFYLAGGLQVKLELQRVWKCLSTNEQWANCGEREPKSGQKPEPIAMGLRHWPEPMRTYGQFQLRYPRKIKLTSLQASSRLLLFNADLVHVGRHNTAYLVGGQTYLLVQSPFKADRTGSEQRDVLSQLDEFNLTQIKMMNSHQFGQNGNDIFHPRPGVDGIAQDLPVSGVTTSAYEFALGGPECERTKSKLDSWLKRTFKNPAHFNIPSYPLDKQPDKSRVTHLDADLRKCTDEIRDQRSCGACYAFSWTSYAEWHFCMQSGHKIRFSPQHIVDCGHLARLGGCTSGLLPNVRDFSHTFGLELESNYEYKGKLGHCSSAQGSVEVKTIDFTRLVVDRREWEQLLEEQPILLEVHSPSDILSYHRGIHPGNNCDHRQGHGMLLVGHGRQDGSPYWLLRNSMGRSWGENGYLRLSRDAPMEKCFHTGFISKFKFKSLDPARYSVFYGSLQFVPTVQPELMRERVNKDHRYNNSLLNSLLKA